MPYKPGCLRHVIALAWTISSDSILACRGIELARRRASRLGPLDGVAERARGCAQRPEVFRCEFGNVVGAR
jgi:hypothetical protein